MIAPAHHSSSVAAQKKERTERKQHLRVMSEEEDEKLKGIAHIEAAIASSVPVDLSWDDLNHENGIFVGAMRTLAGIPADRAVHYDVDTFPATESMVPYGVSTGWTRMCRDCDIVTITSDFPFDVYQFGESRLQLKSAFICMCFLSKNTPMASCYRPTVDGQKFRFRLYWFHRSPELRQELEWVCDAQCSHVTTGHPWLADWENASVEHVFEGYP